MKNNKVKDWYKKMKRKYLNWKNLLIAFISSLFLIPFILIFEYSLNKNWFDGMSVIALIYICLGFLIYVFSIAQFKTWEKFKNLFKVKKENKEEFTNFEKMQMKILNIKSLDNNETNMDNSNKKNTFNFLAFFLILFGLILLAVSLPFVFN